MQYSEAPLLYCLYFILREFQLLGDVLQKMREGERGGQSGGEAKGEERRREERAWLQQLNPSEEKLNQWGCQDPEIMGRQDQNYQQAKGKSRDWYVGQGSVESSGESCSGAWWFLPPKSHYFGSCPLPYLHALVHEPLVESPGIKVCWVSLLHRFGESLERKWKTNPWDWEVEKVLKEKNRGAVPISEDRKRKRRKAPSGKLSYFTVTWGH